MFALSPSVRVAWLGAALAVSALLVVAVERRAPQLGHARSAAPDTVLVATADGVRAPGAPARAVPAGLAPDPEAERSFPQAAGDVRHAAAPAPASVGARISPGAPSDAQIKRDLAEMRRAQGGFATAGAGGGSVGDGRGLALAPPNAPDVVRRIMAGGNAIANFPYVFGGGHASFVDSAYDCSGSVSYALAAGGLLSAPETSGALESWGAPGPGKWITVYANAGHTFMYVAGVRFDTSGRAGPFGSRWQRAPRSTAGFTVRHWPGL